MTYIENVLASPSISGITIQSANYQPLGHGLTNTIFFLGHVDGLTICDPYQVTDIQQAINDCNADPTSPVVKALLEAYYAGARDMYLVAVAPMSEYVADPTQRTNSYYTNYATQLQAGYDALVDWDIVQWIVPLEAPFNCAVDFLTPLENHCSLSLATTGSMRAGLMGTRKGSALLESEIQAIISDPRIATTAPVPFSNFIQLPNNLAGVNEIDDIGQFVAVFVGEGVVNLSEMPTSYTTSVVASTVAVLSQLAINQSIINVTIPTIVDVIQQFSNADISAMANARLNAMTRTPLGKRSQPYQVIMATDNTLAFPGSDYYALSIIKLVSTVVDYIEAYGRRGMGLVGFGQFQIAVQNFLINLVKNGYIQNYTLNIVKDPTVRTKVDVTVSLTPYLGLRTILFTATVGPGA